MIPLWPAVKSLLGFHLNCKSPHLWIPQGPIYNKYPFHLSIILIRAITVWMHSFGVFRPLVLLNELSTSNPPFKYTDRNHHRLTPQGLSTFQNWFLLRGVYPPETRSFASILQQNFITLPIPPKGNTLNLLLVKILHICITICTFQSLSLTLNIHLWGMQYTQYSTLKDKEENITFK